MMAHPFSLPAQLSARAPHGQSPAIKLNLLAWGVFPYLSSGFSRYGGGHALPKLEVSLPETSYQANAHERN